MSVWTLPLLVVGHRGGRGSAWPPENTIAAFEKARLAGARAVELDARTCADGQVVVFHDATLERMTADRDKRPVSDVPFAELERLDLGRGATIPSLAAVLDWARGHDMGVNVELKRDVCSRIALVREVTKVFHAHPADVLWSSFDPMLLGVLAALDVSYRRALLVESGRPAWARGLEGLVRPPLVSAIHLDAERARTSISACLNRGLRVGVWTINEPGEAIALIERGARTVITDAPDRVIAALASRSQ